MNSCKSVCLSRRRDVWMDGWMDGSMDACGDLGMAAGDVAHGLL